jgi:hypothetical protein
MHTEAMWPMHGKYICPRCLREYPVTWEAPVSASDYADVSLRHTPEAVSYNAQHHVA